MRKTKQKKKICIYFTHNNNNNNTRHYKKMMKSHLMIGLVVIVLLTTVTNFAQGKHLLYYGKCKLQKLSHASIMCFCYYGVKLFCLFCLVKFILWEKMNSITGDWKLILLVEWYLHTCFLPFSENGKQSISI